MNTTRRLFTALAAIGIGASAAQAWPSIAAIASAGETGAADPWLLANRCTYGFSKDICEGWMSYGTPYFGRCHTNDTCYSVYLESGRLGFTLRTNQTSCDPTSPTRALCDESPELDGRLEAGINTMLRLHESCRYRGSFDGRWTLTTVSGEVFGGTVLGTLGVGTHRPSSCRSAHQRDCESCVDVEYLGDGRVRIGVEAQFHGGPIAADQANPEDLDFALSGDLYVFTHDDGSINWDIDALWVFSGTADGVHIVCE